MDIESSFIRSNRKSVPKSYLFLLNTHWQHYSANLRAV